MYNPRMIANPLIASLLGLLISPLLHAQTCNPNIPETTPTSRFTLNDDGTVTDTRTGLTWKRCVEGITGTDCSSGTATAMTWPGALQHAAAQSGWRLPNTKELRSIVELKCYDPAINLSLFPNTPTNFVWSGSPYAYNSYYAWGVYFYDGSDYNGYRNYGNHVRLVRGGQSFALLPAPPNALFETTTDGLTLRVNANDMENASYAWELVHRYDPNNRYTATGQSTSFTVSSAGEYQITLTVSNAAGSDSLTQTVTLAEAIPLFALQVQQSGAGTVSGAGDFAAGAAVSLTATPAAGHSFSGWSPAPCATSFAMPASALTCTATFTPIPPATFALTLTQSGEGTVSGAGSFAAGATVSLTATPAAGHSFSGWSPAPCATSFAMPASALTCTATFTPIPPATFALTLTQSGEGTVSGAGSFAAGATVSLTATPAAGHSFSGWSPALCDTSFAMPASALTCTATFIPASAPPPTSGLGKAIIITASGAHQSNSLFPRSEELTLGMYRTLHQRGFEHEDIIWLNPKTWQDVNGDGTDDGVVDNDLFDAENALNQAFEAMRSLQAGQQFVLHIHGHALQNQLKITRDYWLSGEQLKALLDKVPAGVQQVLIIDTCYSGSFLDALKGHPNRILLTASDAQSTAWNAKFATFSGKLVDHLRRGSAVREAFNAAEDMMRGSPELFGNQRPQLDDDGDGVYSSRDGIRAAQVILGKEGSRAADAPEIVQVHPRLVLSSPEAVLWVKTSPSGEQVREVRAALMPPAVATDNYAGEETDFGRVEVKLLYNGAQDRFEVVHHFNQSGIWKALYQAQGLDGTWSEQMAGEIQAAEISKPASVSALLNQSAYAVGEPLRFDLLLNATDETAYDVYAAILFPAGYFVTIRYPLEFSLPGTIIPYQSALRFAPSKTLNILDFPLPAGLPTGTYGGCGVLSPAAHDPWDLAAWVDFQCANFELR